MRAPEHPSEGIRPWSGPDRHEGEVLTVKRSTTLTLARVGAVLIAIGLLMVWLG
ncbi:hypothetical protein GCM10027160_26850 [Streptomyces calidiresistens]